MTMNLLDGGQKAERASLTKAQVADLKLKYGDSLVKLAEQDGVYVFRPPTRAEFARYTTQIVKKREDVITPAERLCLDTLVWPQSDGEPDQARLRALMDKKPGMSMQVAAKIQEEAGVDEDADVGKL